MTIIKVLMLGEALDRPGGLVAVENATLALGSNSLRFEHIATLPKAGLAGGKLGAALAAYGRTFWRLLVGRVNLVHIHVSQGASVYRKMGLAWIAFLFGKPVLLHTHGGDVATRFPTLPALIRWLIACTYRRAAGVIALGEGWRRFYIEEMGVEPARVVIILNPVRIPSPVPVRKNTQGPVRLLYLGMLSAPKGAFDLIQAVARLAPDQRAGLHVTMAGHGEVFRAREEVRALGLGAAVDVRGWIEPEERDALLARMQALVMPSHFEGMPMALLEAMSFGLAVIATPVGAIPDVVTDGENGLFVPVGDIEALAAAMRRLAGEPPLLQAMGANARQSVLPFSAEGYGAHLTRLYREVTAKRVVVGAV